MRLAIDTNRWSDLAAGRDEVRDVLENADELFLPFVVVAELHYGFRRGTRVKENERDLARLIRELGVGVLFPNDATLTGYGELRAQLAKQWTPIPTGDIWIAALTLQFGLTLYLRDDHFRHLSQLSRL